VCDVLVAARLECTARVVLLGCHFQPRRQRDRLLVHAFVVAHHQRRELLHRRAARPLLRELAGIDVHLIRGHNDRGDLRVVVRE
jgi:hypothetical protein